MKKNISIEKFVFVLSLIVFAFLYGVFSTELQNFPYYTLKTAFKTAVSLKNQFFSNESIYYRQTDYTQLVPSPHPEPEAAGNTLIVSVGAEEQLSAKVIKTNGDIVHEWEIDWFDIWPDAEHLHRDEIPQSKPGTHIHGCVVMDDGGLVFNFEHLGLVRIDARGNVLWKLPYRTHHSVFRDESGNLWVSGQINHYENVPGFECFDPSEKNPTIEPTVLKVSPDGEILTEIRLFNLLKKNDLLGLLVMSTTSNHTTQVDGDLLHLNDVEVFPASKREGFFTHGDIMISLRNTNTILVFNQNDQQIKYQRTGSFVRQHDPDFVNGNTVSIFDNFNIALGNEPAFSRILIHSAAGEPDSIYYTGTKKEPFFTNIMGKHQWLENGHLLITESTSGRVFELDANKNIIWEYINIIKPGYIGIVEDAIRLAPKLNKQYFQACVKKCRTLN